MTMDTRITATTFSLNITMVWVQGGAVSRGWNEGGIWGVH